ncbi:MAG: alpha/beta fold hydrolase [Saprospiraceae bacterium]
MKKYLLFALAIQITMQISAQNIIGNWEGILAVQGTELPLIFKITQDGDGLTATMDSPKQNAFDLPTASCKFIDGRLTITAPALGLTFTGKLEGDEIDGNFKQGMMAIPLKMVRMQKEPEGPKVRPQDPKPPFPYTSTDITFENETAGIKLAGTLTVPQNVNNPPVAIMISGSGPQNRDEEIMNHRPFWVWADHLTRQGIAVLRYDDRGVAASEGDFATATSEDFAKDAQAAITYLGQQDQFAESPIGIIGHSEGGMIAPMVAAEDKEVDFIVLLAGPGVPNDELMYLQNERYIETQEIPDTAKQTFLSQQKSLFGLVKTSGDLSSEELEDLVFQEYEKRNGGINLRDNAEIQGAVKQFTAPWMRFFLAYDPAPTLAKVQCPVLAINGGKDVQVVAEQNIPGIEEALTQGGNENFTVKVFPDLNHLFQKAETGQVDEYEKIDETVNVAVLEYVTQWILDIL